MNADPRQILLAQITELSHLYGGDPGFVLAGGGNTSAKSSDIIWVKPSGVSLATIRPDQFVALDRGALNDLFAIDLPRETQAREAEIAARMQAAVRDGSGHRPSVEAPLHNLFDAALVVHTHPTLVNGMTCAQNGADACARLFPDALWVPYIDPGFTLAAGVRRAMQDYTDERGAQPALVFLQNHGVFVAGDGADEVREHYEHIVEVLSAAYQAAGVDMAPADGELDEDCCMACAPPLRTLTGEGDRRIVVSAPPFEITPEPFIPDQIVYTKSYSYSGPVEAESIDLFAEDKGYRPVIVAQPGAVFAAGTSLKTARVALAVARDAARIGRLSQAFGGPRYLDDANRRFIEEWEAEHYRHSVAAAMHQAPLTGKVAVVTGGAQGFGKGIATGLAGAGALVIVADVNLTGAQASADEICGLHGADAARAVHVDIASEESVARMVREIVGWCGGLDLFVANAGVLRAGSVKEMSVEDWEFVTKINYTGYFLCVKHISPVLAAQHVDGRGPWMDIVQINSKSGLQGSNKNGAYAGSKFGTIGLTQSFAKELIEDHVKVNSICPGNYFEGPLWSDPETGLFRQYLDTGKVPGAESIADVKAHYESLVPMGRGCTPADVVTAILYCVAQQYETGQAIPVSGGQVMLK